jgi:hypothetical protein
MPFVVFKISFLFPCLWGLFDFSSKAEVWQNRAKGVERRGMAAPSTV